MPKVFPRCMNNTIEPYVSADGQYYPCCWIANQPTAGMLHAYLTDRLWSQLNIRHNELDDILSSEALQKLRRSWETAEFQPCGFICGSPIVVDEALSRDIHMRASLSDGTLEIE